MHFGRVNMKVVEKDFRRKLPYRPIHYEKCWSGYSSWIAIRVELYIPTACLTAVLLALWLARGKDVKIEVAIGEERREKKNLSLCLSRIPKAPLDHGQTDRQTDSVRTYTHLYVLLYFRPAGLL